MDHVLRFLAAPVVVVCGLWLVEMVKPSPTGTFWVKVGLALAGIGLGSIVPYFCSDDALNLKFAVTTGHKLTEGKGATCVLKFATVEDKRRFDKARLYLFYFLYIGIVIWLANHFFSERLTGVQQTPQMGPSEAQAPLQPWIQWFWLSGVAYCAAAGWLFVYLSLGRKTTFEMGGMEN